MNWMRTLWGKTLLFIGCVIAICLLVLSVFLAVVAWDLELYTQSKDQAFQNMMEDSLGSEALNLLWDVLSENGVYEPNANLVYRITDQNGKVLAERTATETVGKRTFTMASLENESGQATDVLFYRGTTPETENMKLYTVSVGFRKGFPKADYYQQIYRLVEGGYHLRYSAYPIGVISFLLAIACFICLMSVSARQPGTQDLMPGAMHRVPIDLLLILNVGLGVLIVSCIEQAIYKDQIWGVVAFVFGGMLLLSLFIGLSMSISARIKQKNLLKHTAVYILLRGIMRFLKKLGRGILSLVRAIPMVWRTWLGVSALSLAELMVIFLTWWESDVLLVFWILEKILLIPAILWIAITLRKLQKGGQALAGGDLQYRTDTGGMFWDFKRHGENLNSIGRGMGIAVEKQLKSERLKTELITNVSHDIKTPLTSIINYADLIEREPCENEKVQEYAGVLNRQAERLKRLLEDLLEASKASTGNLEVHPVPCDAGIFLSQAVGEYEERLKEKGLQLIATRPEEEVMIVADGRRMWRIFDNLMLNIIKYALPQTRVYLSLEQAGDQAIITFKNTSRESLNISEEELMERFTRGDSARHTEGNGLGLSIARSLAELQGGSMVLTIDGDLFKVVLQFPIL